MSSQHGVTHAGYDSGGKPQAGRRQTAAERYRGRGVGGSEGCAEVIDLLESPGQTLTRFVQLHGMRLRATGVKYILQCQCVTELAGLAGEIIRKCSVCMA